MVKIVLVEKGGNIKTSNLKNFDKDLLYKKCKFINNNNFGKRNTWKSGDKFVSLYAKDNGRAGSENKYDLPPPLDNELYFNIMLLCLHGDEELTNENVIDLNVNEWNQIYMKLMGGFEDLGFEDSEEEEEEIDPEKLTKHGYLKDDFVVDSDDNDTIQNQDEEEKEYTGSETDETSSFNSDDIGSEGLSEEEYEYP
ncbi:hypothetical protein OAI84_00505 [bacterium]|nr:hypothetical protein [bacterium]